MGTKSASVTPARPRASRQAIAPPQRTSGADALFTATQQRVIALLFGQPGRSYFTKELIDLAGGGSGAVQRELHRLQQSGLVSQTLIGNRKHYQANPRAPIYAELCGITSKLLGPAEVLRATLEPLRNRVPLALVYGSVAARRDTASSDLDVLLVSDALTLEQVYEVLESAEKQLGRPINPTLYTVAEFRRRLAQRNAFLTKLLAGETLSLIGDKDAFVAAG